MKQIPIEILFYVIENAIYIHPDELETESDNETITDSEDEFDDWEII
jgi:hypothetical protein